MIVILAPTYTPASAGIVALYRLHDALQQAAVHVSLITYRGIGSRYEISRDCSKWLDPMSLVDIHDSIDFIIIPEVLSADLLPANANLVRYYLNSAGAIVQDVIFREQEFRIAFEPIFTEKPHKILHQYLLGN